MVNTQNPVGQFICYVDAQKGEVFDHFNSVCSSGERKHCNILHKHSHEHSSTIRSRPQLDGIGITGFSGERAMWTSYVDTAFILFTDSLNTVVHTLDMNQGVSRLGAVDFTDDDNYWEYPANNYDTYALDAHWGATQFNLFLKDLFGRESLDDEHHPLVSYVRYDRDYVNAFWRDSAATFGDGDRGQMVGNLPMTVMDIVAHEFTHGLTQYTAGLVYRNEPGALNESYSDIFGIAADIYARPNLYTWLLGDENSRGGEAIRSMSSPKQFDQPDTYKGAHWYIGGADNGGVHTNSGVMNYWYYLLSEGGEGVNDLGNEYSVQSIGWDKAAQIAYRTLTVYLSENSKYFDAAYYSIIASADLYGRCSEEYRQVINAWYAVGLSPVGGNQLQARYLADYSPCDTPVVVNFINLSTLADSVWWDFGDGNTSREISPTHTYTNLGNYDVTMVVSDCTDSSIRDTLFNTNGIVVDFDQPVCDSIFMPIQGVKRITDCSGVIIDPLGFDPYRNNTRSTLILEPSGELPITIKFKFLETEPFKDIITIYDGPDTTATVLGAYSGVTLPDSIVANSGAATFQFISDRSSFFDGFIIDFAVEGGDTDVVGGFEIDREIGPVGYPFSIQSNSAFAAEETFKLDDGAIYLGRSFEHKFSEPGEYDIVQIVSNCGSIDSVVIPVVVTPAGAISDFPDTLAVKLNAGTVLDTAVVFQNIGQVSLYTEVQTRRFLDKKEQSNIYNSTGASSEFTFSGFPDDIESLRMDVVLNGDFGSENEFVNVNIENAGFQKIEDANLREGLNDTLSFFYTADDFSNWLQDDVLSVQLKNEETVNPGFGLDRHTVNLYFLNRSDTIISIDSSAIYEPLESLEIPIRFDARNVLAGNYYDVLGVQSSSTDWQDTTIVLSMEVVGIAQWNTLTDTLDFGETAIGFPKTQYLEILNNGSGPLEISALNLSNSAFEFSGNNLIVDPQNKLYLPIEFVPQSLGSEMDELQFETNIGTFFIHLRGVGINAALMTVTPDSLKARVLQGNTRSEFLELQNTGAADLEYEVLTNAGNPRFGFYTRGADIMNEYQNIRNLLTDDLANYEVLEFDDIQSIPLSIKLNQIDVLILPTVELMSASDLADLEAPLKNFVRLGGSVVFMAESNAVVRSLGLLPIVGDAAITTGENLMVLDEQHPFLTDIDFPLQASNRSRGVLLHPDSLNVVEEIVRSGNGNYSFLFRRNYGKGKVTYLGTDFFETGSAMDRVLKNIIQYSIPSALPAWMTIPEPSGNLPVQESKSISVTLDGNRNVGTYNYELRLASNEPNDDSLRRIPVELIVEAAPVAAFSPSRQSTCTGNVSFTDFSQNLPDDWKWNFGDGTESFEVNPSHTYSRPGLYDVSLITCNNVDCDTLIEYGAVYYDPMSASCDSTLMTPDSTFTITDCSGLLFDSGGAFGDYQRREDNVVVIQPDGASAVKLTVDFLEVEVCCDAIRVYDGPDTNSPLLASSTSRTLFEGQSITSSGNALTIIFDSDNSAQQAGFQFSWSCVGPLAQADFNWSQVSDCSNRIQFENLSDGATSYNWYFGDGNNSQEEDPEHNYPSEGVYVAKLQAINDYGYQLETAEIDILDFPFGLSINVPADTFTVGESIPFSYDILGTPSLIEWDFGNGNSSQEEAPTVIFDSPGEYTIRLNVVLDNGCIIATQRRVIVQITVNNISLQADESFSVFPNPTRADVNCRIELNEARLLTLVLYDLVGHEIWNRDIGNIKQYEEELSLDGISPGVFWLELVDAKGRKLAVQKIIIQ